MRVGSFTRWHKGGREVTLAAFTIYSKGWTILSLAYNLAWDVLCTMYIVLCKSVRCDLVGGQKSEVRSQSGGARGC